MALAGLASLAGSFSVSGLAFTGAVAVLIYLCIWPVRLDAREPPMIRPRIPFIGHLIGLISKGNRYADVQYSRHGFPAHTLPILGGKLYIVNSAKMADAVIRNRSLGFDAFVDEFLYSMTDMDKEGLQLFQTPEFHSNWVKILYRSMTGQGLIDLNVRALNNIADAFNRLPTPSGLAVSNLHEWVRQIISVATTTSLLGSNNPFKDRKLLTAYWDFETDFHKLLMNVVPWLIAPKAYNGRAAMHKAFELYHTSKHDEADDVPEFTRDRIALKRKFGLNTKSCAALELAVIHASLFNTILTTYWTMTYIFSQPDLVAKLREEVIKITEDVPSEGKKRKTHLHISRIESTCPLLMASLRETQRMTSMGTLNRKVEEDTTISDGSREYLLKKGNSLQVAHSILHGARENWGDDASEFDVNRFFKPTTETALDNGKVSQPVFLPFGGGKHICPGRSFATGEILGFVAMMLLGFDIMDETGGPLEVPDVEEPPLTAGIGKPKSESDVSGTIRRREGWKDTIFAVVP